MRIIPVDCNYVEEEFATAYLLIENDRGFFVECNTNHAIPYLLEAVKKEGLTPDQIEGLLVTHIHLDHAGGAGLFLREFPNAKLYAHPKAARHAIDPSKLVESATAVYGEKFMQKLYGTILPCEASRVVVLEDGDTISFRGDSFQTRHTRGHANHHLVMIEPKTKTLFSGDAFGVSYPHVNEKHGLIALASTSPTDFDGEAALEAIDWIASRDLEQVGLTHYGFIPKDKIADASDQLRGWIQYSMELVARIQKENLSLDRIEEALHEWLIQSCEKKGQKLDQADLKHLGLDLKVNAQGLRFAAFRPRQKSA